MQRYKIKEREEKREERIRDIRMEWRKREEGRDSKGRKKGVGGGGGRGGERRQGVGGCGRPKEE